MSLINRMLQDLDARGADGVRAGHVLSEVRAVAEQRGSRLGWWVALALALLLGGASSWIWLRATQDEHAQRMRASDSLPLKFSANMTALPSAAATPAPATAAALPAADTEPAAPAAIKPAPQTAVVETAPPKEATIVPAAPAVPKPAPLRSAPAPVVPQSPNAAPQADKKTEQVEMPKPADHSPQTGGAKQIRELTASQRAENEYRRAASALAQGKTAEAEAAFEQALATDPRHAAARQTLVGMLLDAGRQDDAVRKLQEGLALDAGQSGLAMILARLQVEKKDIKAAIGTLQRSMPHASDRADYRAFLAALLQRQGQHGEAIEHYAVALRMTPQNAVWWMGLGISLQAENRLADAREAFGRARAGGSLSPDLQAFVEQKLSQLPR